VAPEMWKANGVQWVCLSSKFDDPYIWPGLNRFVALNAGRLPLYMVPPDDCRVLEAELECKPNTGFVAIWDSLRFDIQSLYVTGISFFRGGYLTEYRPMNEEEAMAFLGKGEHKQPPQIAKMRKLVQTDSRLTVDATLQAILDET